MKAWWLPLMIAVGLLATRGGRADAASAAGIVLVCLWAAWPAARRAMAGESSWPTALWLGWSLLGAECAPDPQRSLFAWAHLCGLAGVAALAAQAEARPDVSAGFGRTATRRWMIVAVGSAFVLAACSLAGTDLLAGKNMTGGFLALGAALAAGLVTGRGVPGGDADGGVTREGHWILRTSLLVILAGLISTRSLGAWMGAAAAVATWGLARRRWRGMAGAAVACLAAAAMMPSRTLESVVLGNPDDPYSRVRSVLWRAAARTSLDHPVFGVGLDHSGTTPDMAAPVVPGTPVRRLKWTPFAHSEYLQAVVESGWPAAAALAWLMTLLARAAWRHLSDPIPSPARVAAALAAIAGLTHAMVDFTLHLPLIAATVAAAAGVILVEPPRPEPGWRPAGWGAIFPGLMITAALCTSIGFRGGFFASRYEPARMAGPLTEARAPASAAVPSGDVWPAVARFSEGEEAMARGRWLEAEAGFRGALREEPRLARAQVRLAEIAAARGDRPLALRRRRIAEEMFAANAALRRSIRYATEGYGEWVLGL